MHGTSDTLRSTLHQQLVRLELSLASPESLARWADELIASLEEPPAILIELSLSSSAHPLDLVGLIRTVVGEPSSAAIEGVLKEAVQAFRAGGYGTGSLLGFLRPMQGDLRPMRAELGDLAMVWEHHIEDAHAGVFGTVEDAEREFINDLGRLLDRVRGAASPKGDETVGTWAPASIAWVKRQLERELESLPANHRRRLRRLLVSPFRVPVEDCPGESVVVVAVYEGSVLYFSDIEGGWQLESLTAHGGILSRGSSQDELSHVVRRLWGDSREGVG